MFTLQHICKSYANKVVLDDVALTVNAGEAIALIGENGAGKTTLLNVILGNVEPDSGAVVLHREVIGYIPQEPDLAPTLEDNFPDRLDAWKADYALGLVGFEAIPKNTLVSSLSGGQKTRLAFAKVLAADPEPTVLLLDEPTNNLDAEGLRWLEGFVKAFQGAVLLVSHDRTFINKVATSIAELDNGMLKLYGGNYDFYKQQKEIERRSEREQYQQNKEERRRLENSLHAVRSKARVGTSNRVPPDNDKFAKGFFHNRIQAKAGGRARQLEARLAQLPELQKPAASKNHRLSLQGKTATSKLLLRLNDIAISYDKPILQGFNLEIRGSERVHIAGSNGSGKTTLLKIAASLIEPDDGEVITGQDVRIGYFSQDVDGLHYQQTSLENLATTGAATTTIYRQARSLGLTEAELRKKPGELSRGQQAKLSFAKLLLSANHLLILDEPTNHLDIPTRESIEVALQDYQGALLVASHDGYFVERLGVGRTITVDEVRKSSEKLVTTIRSLTPPVNRPLIVAVSGFSGSGKSTLADTLTAQLSDANTVCIDSFATGKAWRRSADWDNFDRDRFAREILKSAHANKFPLRYAHKPDLGNIDGQIVAVPKVQYLIVEGCSLFHPDLLGYYDYTIWVDCPLDEAARRGMWRDKHIYKSPQEELWLNIWIPNERDFYAKYRPDRVADVVIMSEGSK